MSEVDGVFVYSDLAGSAHALFGRVGGGRGSYAAPYGRE